LGICVFRHGVAARFSEFPLQGEVFPEGGEVERHAVSLPRKTERCRAGTRLEKLVENTLEPPRAWEVALPAGKGKREKIQAVPAASTGHCLKPAHRGTSLPFS
jgi:hypothetical protein